MPLEIYSTVIILALQETKSTVFQISIEIPIVKLASKFSCQEVTTILSHRWKPPSLKIMSYAGEEKDNKEGEHVTKCTIRKKIQTIVSISVVKEDLHT